MTVAYGVVRPEGLEPRVCARVNGRVVDLSELGDVFRRPSLNGFMALGRNAWRETTERVRRLDAPLVEGELLLPFEVADYVDFFSSLEHAINAGRLLRFGSEPLHPNWRHLPVGYHGRAASVVVSGTPVRRPHGQREPGPTFGPSERLDIELELGFVVGTPSRLGEPVPIADALEHVFGIVLLNDWSARDIQAWESRPLGPFLSKASATTISGWVVPIDEVAGFRLPLPPQEPQPLEYLAAEPWAYDLALEIEINGTVVSRTSSRHLYWSIEQQLAHLTSGGAALRTGDLLGSGTISGPDRGSLGSLLELNGNERFLEDGDEVVLRAPQVDLEARGRIVP